MDRYYDDYYDTVGQITIWYTTDFSSFPTYKAGFFLAQNEAEVVLSENNYLKIIQCDFLSLTVEVYLRWKLQIYPVFVSVKPWKIGSVSNTYLPHCTYFKQPSTFLLTHKFNQKYITWT